MASRYEIKCINKTDRSSAHDRIEHIGGINGDGSRWRITQQQAVEAIESGKFAFFVRKGTVEVNVIVQQSFWDNKYIKTQNDGEQPNNLLSLPECP